MSKERWYYYKWRFASKPIEWWVDLLLIDQIVYQIADWIKPSLWRFHRRSGDDEASHQFTLFVLCDEKGNVGCLEIISKNSVLLGIDDKIIDRSYGIAGKGNDLSAMCDPQWPDYLQNTWIYFVMGLCRTYMEIVHEVCMSKNQKSNCAGYQKAEREIDALWQVWGGHAFFHHTNAIFGYEPTLLHPRKTYMAV